MCGSGREDATELPEILPALSTPSLGGAQGRPWPGWEQNAEISHSVPEL